MTYETILAEQRGAVTLITLNRPKALNALNNQVLEEMIDVMAAFDADESQRCAVVTGSDRAFAAGADIKEMSEQDFGQNKEQWIEYLRMTAHLEAFRAACRQRSAPILG